MARVFVRLAGGPRLLEAPVSTNRMLPKGRSQRRRLGAPGDRGATTAGAEREIHVCRPREGHVLAQAFPFWYQSWPGLALFGIKPRDRL